MSLQLPARVLSKEDELAHIQHQAQLALQQQQYEKWLLEKGEEYQVGLDGKAEALALLTEVKKQQHEKDALLASRSKSLQELNQISATLQKKTAIVATETSRELRDFEKEKEKLEEKIRVKNAQLHAETEKILAEAKRIAADTKQKEEKLQKEIEKAKEAVQREQLKLNEMQVARQKKLDEIAAQKAMLNEMMLDVFDNVVEKRVAKEKTKKESKNVNDDNEEDDSIDDSIGDSAEKDGVNYDEEEEEHEEDEDEKEDGDEEEEERRSSGTKKLGKRRRVLPQKISSQLPSKVAKAYSHKQMIDMFAPIGRDVIARATVEEKELLKSAAKKKFAFSNVALLAPLDKALRERIARDDVKKEEVFEKLASFITKYISDNGTVRLDFGIVASEVLTICLLVNTFAGALDDLNEKVKQRLSASTRRKLDKRTLVNVTYSNSLFKK